MKIKSIFCALILSVGCISCNLKQEYLPEFTITQFEYREEQPFEQSFLPSGLYFTFKNTASKKIILIETKLSTGDRLISFCFDGELEANETKELCIPLSDYQLNKDGTEPFIDSFYVSKIVYSDSSFWIDLFGTYAI